MIREVSAHTETGSAPVLPDRLRGPGADPYAVLDGLGVIVVANDALAAAVGADAAGLAGRPLEAIWRIEAEPGQPDSGPELLDRVRREAIVRVDAHPIGGEGRIHALVLFVHDGAGGDELGLTIAGPGRPVRGTARVAVPIDQLAVGMAVYGLDGSVVHLNEAMYRLLGRTPEDMPASDTLLVHPDDRAGRVGQAVRAYRGEIDGWTAEKRIVRPDGEVVWVNETVTLVRDESGAPLQFLAQNVDVTEARRHERALAESEAQVRLLTDGLPVALVELDADCTIANGNAAARDLFGDEIVGRSFMDVTHADDRRRVRHAFADPDAARDCQLELRVCRRDGEWRWVRAHARLHVDHRGRLTSAVSTLTDITDEVAARESSEQLGDLLESVEDIVAVADADARITYLNASGRSLVGDAGDDHAGEGRPLTDLFTRESARVLGEVGLPTVQHFGSWTGEAQTLPPGLEPRVVLLSLVSHTDARSGQTSISALARDITELKRAEEAMRRQATTDPLTGLPNRAIMFDRLGHALARTNRNGGGLALLFVDLDRFKAVNDEMGHDAGDELLVQVARRLVDSVRDCDTVARIGGDEFVVLAEPVIRSEDALVVANRIVSALCQPFTLAAGEATIGASVGVAMSDRRSSARTLLKQADTAVYQAKSAGRSRVVTFEG